MATNIAYSVPGGSFDFWIDRFEKHYVIYNKPSNKFGEQYLTFLDPDGLKLELVIPKNADSRKGWETDEVKAKVALKGFHGVTLTVLHKDETAAVLTDVFGYKLEEQSGNRYRYMTDAVETANIIDLVELPHEPRGLGGAGTNHHIAFRVKNEEVLMQFHDKIAGLGYNITNKKDRNYFYSLYFREPGGVLFEIATDNPGFGIDEPWDQLGTNLMLPPQYESRRAELEAVLPQLD
ncbi:ring-cleaving dioxygenase [Pontibacter flavimaris]|uniref:ring-cleaving dioxygenase n=1 Tax=Pontibacter flavimaris TaxID=1797110 RepID=UPI000A554B0C|nr:ring-cleaving dioxygenase [Pontibacter flavimaris]